jgi:hypothetical protein
MKKWKEALGEIRNTTANAVNSAVRQIDKSLTNEALPSPQPERPADQQFLRWASHMACAADSHGPYCTHPPSPQYSQGSND